MNNYTSVDLFADAKKNQKGVSYYMQIIHILIILYIDGVCTMCTQVYGIPSHAARAMVDEV